MTRTIATAALLACTLFVLPQPGPAGAEALGEEQWVELELRGWAPTLSGSVRSSETAVLGNDVDYARTLGVDTRQNFFWPRAAFHFAESHRLTASLLHMNYAGDSTVTQAFTFAGTTFPVSEAVHSEIQFTQLTGGYQFDLVKFPRFSVNLNLQAHLLDLDAEVRGNTLGTVKEDITVPVPTIGGGVRIWPFEWMKLSGDFNIFKAGVSGFRGELIDSEASLTISPWKWVGLGVGYRYFRGIARDTDSNDQIDWLQQGPFVAIVVRPF